MEQPEKVIARELARHHKEISVAEFFERNKHLLGFENPTKALLTCVREAVDNALDACEEARILPDIYVEVKQVEPEKYRIVVEDNGPGIPKSKIPKVFGKLLYGSKFSLRQSRGQQGIGISAAVLYAQLTTGVPTKVYSRIGDGKTHIYQLYIDVKKNEPEIISEKTIETPGRGTRIELVVKGRYMKGKSSIDEYLRETAIMNPFARIVYVAPDGRETEFERAVEELPPVPREIQPHPHGVELGFLARMLKQTKCRNLSGFLTTELSRIGRTTVREICERAGIDPSTNPKTLTMQEVEALIKAMRETKIQAPPTDCLSPVGEEAIKQGIRKETRPEFIAVVSRKPTTYRGYPFQVEVGIGYGGDIPAEGPAEIMRFANRVPLLYQQAACAITRAITSVAWQRYGIKQPNGGLPHGPLVIAVHIASVWIPYTSEGKEAIASYPEIVGEIKKALQEAGRKLSVYLSKRTRQREVETKKRMLESYSIELASVLAEITGERKENILEWIHGLVRERVKEVDITVRGKGIEISTGEEGEQQKREFQSHLSVLPASSPKENDEGGE